MKRDIIENSNKKGEVEKDYEEMCRSAEKLAQVKKGKRGFFLRENQ